MRTHMKSPVGTLTWRPDGSLTCWWWAAGVAEEEDMVVRWGRGWWWLRCKEGIVVRNKLLPVDVTL